MTGKIYNVFITAAIVLMMVMSVNIVSSEAAVQEYSGGTGTAEDPYLIANQSDLANVKNHDQSHFRMTADITVTAGWKSMDLSGTFDGNGHTIKGLDQSLFDNINTGGLVRDLNIENFQDLGESSAYSYAGSIAIYNEGTILRCSASGTIKYHNLHGGGIVAHNHGTISNCSSEIDVRSRNAGGIAGYNGGTISGCSNSGYIDVNSYGGGIAGENSLNGIIEKCYNSGRVSSKTCAGGIAGSCGSVDKGYKSVIRNCHSTGRIVGCDPYDEAFTGHIAGKCESNAIIENCYSTCSVNYLNCKGITGNGAGSVSNCYYLSPSGDKPLQTGTGCTMKELQDRATFRGFDFDKVWSISSADTYKTPVLRSVKYVEPAENMVEFQGGNGSTYDPYLISTKEQLDNVRKYPHASFRLVSDIVFAKEDFELGGAFYNEGKGWLSIVNFDGEFDGNGHVIKGLKGYGDYHARGLFYNSLGTIRNLGMVESRISYTEYAGGITAQNYGYITNCYNTGYVGAGSYAGGIAGENEGSIVNCYNTGTIRGYGAGGISGYNTGSIVNCYSASESSKYGIADGSGTVTGCYYLDENGGDDSQYGSACTKEEMLKQQTYKEFDFNDTWSMPASGSYRLPVLKRAKSVYEENETEFVGGNGTAHNPYMISNKTHLDNMRKYPSAHFRLVSDIVFSKSDFSEQGQFYNAGQGWIPVGASSDNTEAFTGSFDGEGHVIKGLEVRTDKQYAGLFGYIKYADVKNLAMNDGDISMIHSGYAGPICGYNEKGNIINCSNTCKVGRSSGIRSGGITGYNDGVIERCHNDRNANGITLDNFGTIKNCYNTADGVAYGITCFNDGNGIIEDCYNTGDISSTDNAAGIALHNYKGAKILRCYNTGNIRDCDSEGGAGGIVSDNRGSIEKCYNTGRISGSEAGGIAAGLNEYGYVLNCYNTGDIRGKNAGGIAGGIPRDGQVSRSYSIGTVDGYKRSGVTPGKSGYSYYLDTTKINTLDTSTAYTLEQMQNKISYAGFDFGNIWEMSSSGDYRYPVLKGMKNATIVPEADNKTEFLGGNGTKGNPYLISEKAHLDNVRKYPDASFRMTADITFDEADFAAGGAFYNGGKGWIPICGSDDQFTGDFDGAGHTVTGLKVNTDGWYAGLFSHVNFGSIKNLRISSCSIVTSNSWGDAGGVTAFCSYGNISGCCISGEVYGDTAGGIVGESNSGNISDCYNTAYVSGRSHSGGIAGTTSYGKLKNCYAAGTVGQEIGYNDGSNTTMENIICLNSTDVEGNPNLCTAETMQKAETYKGYDLSNVWTLDPYGEYKYPQLRAFVKDNVTGIEFDKSTPAAIDTPVGLEPDISSVKVVVTYASGKTVTAPLRSDSLVGYDSSKVGQYDAHLELMGVKSKSVLKINVNEKKATSIKVIKQPDKIKYVQNGSGFDPAGAVINVVYDNGTKEDLPVTADMISVFDNSKVGKCQVTVTYQEKTDVIDIDVLTIDKVSLVSAPTKTKYVKDQPLNTEGGILKVTYSDATTEDIPLSRCTMEYDKTAVGNVTVSASYEGSAAVTFDITVADKKLTGINVTEPDKIAYIEALPLDLTGGKVILNYESEDGYSETIDMQDSMVSGYDPNKIGSQTITVTYEGMTATFNVTVKEKTLTSVTMKKEPAKTVYEYLDKLDVKGGAVDLHYDNNTVTEIPITDEMVSGYDGSRLGDQDIKVTYTGLETSFKVKVGPKDVNGCVIEKIADPVFTGEKLTPELVISNGAESLVKGFDYEAVYSDNIHAGTAQVVITGTGNYKGTVTKTFTVKKADIKDVDVAGYTGTYDGLPHFPEVSGNLTDTTVTYAEQKNGIYTVEKPLLIEAGTKTVYYRVERADYNVLEGSVDIVVERAPVDKMNMMLSETSYVFDGTEKKPSVTIEGLKEGRDFTVTYAENVNAGTAKVTAEGTGNYQGIVTKTFTINKADITDVSVKGYKGAFDGKAHSVAAEGLQKGDAITYSDSRDGQFTAENPAYTAAGTKTVYYKVERANHNVLEGSADVVIDRATVDGMTAVLGQKTYVYDGTEKKPAVTVEGLTADRDFTVSYRDNVNAGTAKAIVEGTGNYQGTITETFTIEKADITDVTVEGYKGTFDGKTHSITVKGVPEGAVVKYSDSRTGQYTEENPAVSEAGTKTIYYRVEKDNYNNVEGSAEIVISKAPIDSLEAVLSHSQYVYDGTEKKPAVTIEGLKEGRDFTVKYTGNVNAGSAEVTIEGTGSCTGTITRTFTISKADIDDISVKGFNGDYDGQPHGVTAGGNLKDATVTYSETREGTYGPESPVITEPGTKTVYYRVEKPNYNVLEGSTDIVVSRISIDGMDAVLSETGYSYDGTEKKPSVTIDGLTEGEDFTVTYRDNTAAGTASAIIEGTGHYQGTITKTFEIAAVDITGLSVNGYKGSYDAKAHTITVKGVKTGDRVTYSLSKDGQYSAEHPAVKDAGTTTVYFKVDRDSHNTFSASADIEITKSDISGMKAVLSADRFRDDGKTHTPSVTVTSSAGGVLEADTDYTVSFPKSDRRAVGRYEVKITGQGNCTGEKSIWYTVVPGAPDAFTPIARIGATSSSIYSVRSTGHDDVVFDWPSVKGASGYYVYYKLSGASKWTYIGSGKGSYCRKYNLYDGRKYYFKALPYYQDADGKKYAGFDAAYGNVWTLKRLSTPYLSKYGSSKIKVRWNDIPGQSGYQISSSYTKSGTHIISTYGTTSGEYKTFGARKGKTYYMKVRAYKNIYIKGHKYRVYGPWSYPRAYKMR